MGANENEKLTWNLSCVICHTYIAGNPNIPKTSDGLCKRCFPKEIRRVKNYFLERKKRRKPQRNPRNSRPHLLVRRSKFWTCVNCQKRWFYY